MRNETRARPWTVACVLGACAGALGANVGCQGEQARSVQGSSPNQPALAPASEARGAKASERNSASQVQSGAKTEGAGAAATGVPTAQTLTPTSGPSGGALSSPPLRSEQKGFVVFVPSDCMLGREHYDLVVHFHGIANAVQAEQAEAGLVSVLAVANAGAWARDYRRDYGNPGTLNDVLSRVTGEVDKLCPGTHREVGRLALSGWSAGYSVIRHILSDSGPERVDAVLLSDGIHASLAPSANEPRGVLPVDVESFVAFGRLAVDGKKLFSITHSSIQTPDYASTTETTNYLLAELGLTRSEGAGAERGSLLDGEPSRDASQPISEVQKGGFHLRGYRGPTAPDHIWQLHSMGPTLFSDLKAWWNR